MYTLRWETWLWNLDVWSLIWLSYVLIVLIVSDEAIGEVFKACEETGYVLMVTSDHGNAEQMFSEQGGPHTAHTTNRGN